MSLAIFDLDNTLLAGDSDHRWGEFLCEKKWTAADDYRCRNDQFYADYQAGCLDMPAYLSFVLGPLEGKNRSDIQLLQYEFIRDCIEPMLLDKAFALINQHRIAGDILLLMTATHAVVAEPVAARLGFEHWLCSGVGMVGHRYTGEPEGPPCFQEGKVVHLEQWRAEWRAQGHSLPDLNDTWFYSDSHNDLPLLSAVGHPVAVDPDPRLEQHAEEKGWSILSLRD
jgi:HAD superfamily hydrolase (TIGR01490 family)